MRHATPTALPLALSFFRRKKAFLRHHGRKKTVLSSVKRGNETLARYNRAVHLPSAIKKTRGIGASSARRRRRRRRRWWRRWWRRRRRQRRRRRSGRRRRRWRWRHWRRRRRRRWRLTRSTRRLCCPRRLHAGVPISARSFRRLARGAGPWRRRCAVLPWWQTCGSYYALCARRCRCGACITATITAASSSTSSSSAQPTCGAGHSEAPLQSLQVHLRDG
jgi:hypothetical protein